MDGPESGGGDGSGPNRRVLGVALAVGLVVVLILGIGASLLMSGPEEVRDSDWAEMYCEETVDSADELHDASEDLWDVLSDARDDDYEFSNVSTREAEEIIEKAKVWVDAWEKWLDSVDSFNGGHVLRGDSGVDFQEDLDEWVADSREEIADAREDISDVDPEDGEDAAEDIYEISIGSVELDHSDEAAEIAQAIAEEDEDCTFPYYIDGE